MHWKWIISWCEWVTDYQYREAVEALDAEREKWEREMMQYAKVCLYVLTVSLISDGHN